MGAASVQQMADRVAALLEERLRLRGDTLAAKLKAGRRALPKKIRMEAEYLAMAAEHARAPKLELQLDHERIAAAYDACLHYLKPLGAAERRRGMLLDIAARVALVVLVTAVLVLSVLVWRGYL